MLEFLLSHGMGGAPILHALAFGDDQPDLRLRLIKLCHRFGATVPLETSDSGDTSVHSAAGSGQLEILKYLVEEMDGRAAFRKVNDLDYAPLHEAVANGRLDCARYLWSRAMTRTQRLTFCVTTGSVGRFCIVP